MTRTFKVLSALLSYPTADMQAAIPELADAIDREAPLPAGIRRQLDLLLNQLATGDLYDLQERYVLLFDRTRSLSLHLFEHVHGESRDRGQAMIDLKALYENGGLEIDAAELPDFVPLFLEFLSTRPRPEAYDLLAQPAHVLAAMAERLRKIFAANRIDTVIDVGANKGQYRDFLRHHVGFRGSIVSFEPLPEFAASLKAKADVKVNQANLEKK